MEDVVRTTQEQLSLHPLGEALNAPKPIEKCSNWLKSAVFALLIFAGRITTCGKLALATALFSCV